MVAIITKYYGPTNHRGSRILVKSDAGKVSRMTVSWDHALNPEDNHHAAALAYVKRNGWDQDCYGRIVGGGIPHGYAFVFVKDPTLATDGATYTVEPGRNIYRDGAPFVAVTREGDTRPVVADYLTHRIANFLNGKADA